MIELYIDGKLVDLEDSVGILLQKEFETDDSNIVEDVEFSYQIELPITDRNKVIFGFAETFDVQGKFNRTFDARLVADGLSLLEGKLKLSEISFESYKGNLYSPKKSSVSDVLGDRMLSGITPHYVMMSSLEDFRKVNNYVANLDDSDIPQMQYRDRHVCFPYVLYGVPFNVSEVAQENEYDLYTQDLEFGSHRIWSDNVFPAFNVLSVLQDVFATEGYRVIGNIFDDVKFKDLYQTMQYSYSDYKKMRQVPYYLEFNCNYSNYRNGNIPYSLQVATLWSDDVVFESNNDRETDGTYKAGVDCPLVAESDNSTITIVKNDQHIMVKGSSSEGYSITVPQSGWYRFYVNGQMSYPYTSTEKYFEVANRELVGSTIDAADNTDFTEQPFEFQVKKGYPADSPKLYSFNSLIPCIPTSYAANKTIISTSPYNSNVHTYIRCQDVERQNYYGKNEKTTLIKDYSDFPTSDFICGARLGGALFTNKWANADCGELQRPQRFALKGAALALPDVTKTPILVDYDEDGDGEYYFQIDGQDYAEKTAQILVRDDSYSNFEGYNVFNPTASTWDTTSNVGAVEYAGQDYSFAHSNRTNGNWTINTCVWLEEGDNISIELIMPLHTRRYWHHGGAFRCAAWKHPMEWVNVTNVNFNFKMGIVSTEKDWRPSTSEPMPNFLDIQSVKPTNVNQFLPAIKCNDYLNGFLKAFNLRLTMPYNNVFSIDSVQSIDTQTNVINLDELVNPSQAIFKALDTPSRKELCWKNDNNERGYKIGNDSPYKLSDFPWDESGYSGNFIIENDANTSGSIDKKESQWSYSWYTDIRFRNGLGLTPFTMKCLTICDASNWDNETTWYNADKSINTSKTMRLFYLGKSSVTKMYNYIDFNYDKDGNSNYKTSRLLLPSNSIEKSTLDGNTNRLYLDYDDNAVAAPNKTLTDAFFYIKKPYQFEVEAELTLPNYTYAKMTSGTMCKLNDGLFKVVKIEGHDVEGKDPSTLTLRTLQ